MSYRLPGLQSLFAFVGFMGFVGFTVRRAHRPEALEGVGFQPEGIDKFYEPDRVSGLRSEVSSLPSPVSGL